MGTGTCRSVGARATAPPSMGTWEEYQQRRHFQNLDGLRGLNILSVMVFHFWAPIPFPVLDVLGNRGFLGVDMFYVLSGYLIVTLLLRERDRSGSISLKKFYMRRTLRIFPAYYFFLLFLGVLCVAHNKGAFALDDYLRDLPYLVTYTFNWFYEKATWDIAWSLATEEQFYLVWPWVVAFLARKNAFRVAVVVLMLNWIYASWGPNDLIIQQSTYAPILLGVVIAHVLHDPQGFERASSIFGNRYSTLVSTALLFILLVFPNDDIQGLHRTCIHVMLGAFLLSVVVREDTVGSGALRNRFVTWTGELSYGLYLWHMIGLAFAGLVIKENALVRGLLGAVLSYIIAAASYFMLERFFIAMKKRWDTKTAMPAPAA